LNQVNKVGQNQQVLLLKTSAGGHWNSRKPSVIQLGRKKPKEEPLTPGQAERVKELYNSLMAPPAKAKPAGRSLQWRLVGSGASAMTLDDPAGQDIVQAAARCGLNWNRLSVPQRRQLRSLACTMAPADTVRQLVLGNA
jgi:hypothetical protein